MQVAWLTALLLTSAASFQEPDQVNQRYKKWEENLNRCFAKLPANKASILFDVDPRLDAPLVDSGSRKSPLTLEDLRVLAAFTNRYLEDASGVQVFRRRSRNDPKPKSGLEAIEEWVKNLDPETIRQLAGGGVAFQSLPDEVQRTVLKNVGMLAPDALDEITDRLESGSFKLRMSHGFRYRDESGQTREFRFNQNYVFPDDKARKAVTSVSKRAIVPIPAPPTGELSFPDGEVLTLKDLVLRAEAAFKKRFDYDARLSDWRIYARGEISREAFLDALGKMTDCVTVVDLGEAQDMGSYRADRLLDGPLADLLSADERSDKGSGMTPKDFRSRRTVSVAELASGPDNIGKSIAHLKLSDQTQVELTYGLVMIADFGGFRTSPDFSAKINGRQVGQVPNLFAIGLPR